MAWSDAARAAALAARRAHAKGKQARSSRARATYKPSTFAKQAVARSGEDYVRRALRAAKTKGTGGTNAVDVAFRRGGHLHGVEVKTLMDNKNNKITMHPSSRRRKISWAHSHRAVLHTVVVDARSRYRALYYHRGVGAFRMGSLTRVSTAQLRSLIGG